MEVTIIKLIQKFILASVFLVLLAMSLSSVNSANVTFTGLNTTSEIQNVINTTNYDIVLEGQFNNLSTINITRNIRISGNNATITRNASGTNNLILFNITAFNVTIENLKIIGYNTAIVSNSSNILIQNNQITQNSQTSANNYATINITTNDDLNNVKIKNNVISTSRTNATGIHLSSNHGSLYNNIIFNNTITTAMGGAHGIYLSSYQGSLYNNDIYSNDIITTQSANAYGIYLRSENGNIANNNISRNNVTTRNDHGIYLITQSGNIDNNLISYNNVLINIPSNATGSIRGIFLSANNNGANITNNNLSNNNIKIDTTGTAPSRGIELYTNNGRIDNNTISANNILMNTANTNSYGMYIYGFTGNVRNVNIHGNDIVVNCTAIYVGTTSNSYTISNVNISYNRILTDKVFINLNRAGINNTASANWFGNNTPDMNKFVNVDVLSYYVVNAIAVKNNALVGENWTIKYMFYLNNTNETGDSSKLPFFKASLLNSSNEKIDERIAYDNGIWNIAIEYPKTDEFTIILDNEIINLNEFVANKGQTNIIMEIEGDIAINNTVVINGILKDSQGNVLANKNIRFIVDGELIETGFTDSNGKVSFNYTFNNFKDYNFQLAFEGNDDYEASINNTNFTIVETSNNVTINEEPDFIAPDNTENGVYDDNQALKISRNSPDHLGKDNGIKNAVANESKSSNNSDIPLNSNVSVKASMNNTGIPIALVLLVLIANIGLLVYKRK